MLIRTSWPAFVLQHLLDLEAVNECAPQAVVDHDERRHRHFAGWRLGRQRVFRDARELGVFALELAAIFEQQRLGNAARHHEQNRECANEIPDKRWCAGDTNLSRRDVWLMARSDSELACRSFIEDATGDPGTGRPILPLSYGPGKGQSK